MVISYPISGYQLTTDKESVWRSKDLSYLFAVCNYNLDSRKFTFIIFAIRFHNSSKRVLQKLKEHMTKMGWDIHKLYYFWAVEMHFWRFEKTVIVFTYESSIIYSFLRDFCNIGSCTNHSHVVFSRRSSEQS